MKTPKEILAMDNVNFPPPPPMVGTPEKRNMNKLCDYHQDRGHNTNDYYHLKKQIEEVVASGRLAHLVKDIRQGSQKGKGLAKGKEKVINMVRSQGYRKRPYERAEHWMDNAITFPSVPRYQLMNCPVVVEAIIKGFRVRRIEVMYEHCFRSLRYRTRSRLRESRIPLVGFSGEVSYPMGVIDLEVTIGECGKTRTVIIEFAVVKSPSLYNALLGRTEMRSLGAVASTIHSMMKFQTSNGIVTISTTRETLRECRQIEEAQDLSRHARVTDLTLMQTSSEVANPRLSLAPNVDIFAWTPADITGIPRAITEHSLDTYPHIEPKAQKKRSLATYRRKVMTDEVNEWLKAGIIRRVRYPTWVANPVLVKKVDRSWRMCIDFKDLNKACPKDLYPLPEIDWKIESLMGFQYKCFLDAYKGYHQIQMTKKDEEKTTFHTEEGVFCYTKMPFGLKNARATYQRLVDSAFKEKIWAQYLERMWTNGELSVDLKDIIKDIEQTFSTLRRINMKLNPKKCSFAMEEGKFLGYVVTSEGIRANPEKAKAVMDMSSPKTLKQMQSLSGKLAALNQAAEAAFLEMKKLVSELPTLTTPKKGETLMMAAANEAVSAVLLTERNGRQMPIHYVSRSLQGAETKYAPMEKLALALVHAARRLRRGLRHNVCAKGSKKGQVLADFIADTPTVISATAEVPNNPRVEDIPEPSNARGDLTHGPKAWRLYTDGASNNEGFGAGLILIAPDDVEYSYALRLNFSNSNNDVEYEALLARLRIAKEMQVRDIHAFVDSKLVASQVEGLYEAKGARMIKYQEQVLELAGAFNRFRITHIPRVENRKADALSKLAAVQFDHMSKEVLVEVLNERSIEAQEVNVVVEEQGPT
ncbi:reverse transcriptase domain-containing protein [Tanacetum coccineum]|uniref:Reverse transcriptase domain-containing protein n=1 Tax=Tanacetum coccineum TaxID=301880 RepID=A0ABQ5J2G0_9ASTR